MFRLFFLNEFHDLRVLVPRAALSPGTRRKIRQVVDGICVTLEIPSSLRGGGARYALVPKCKPRSSACACVKVE